MRSPVVNSWAAFVGLLICNTLIPQSRCLAQGIASIANVTQRPFVTGVTPVIGPNGFVGGVFVDTNGVVSRPTQDALGELKEKWKSVRLRPPKELAVQADMRMISLKQLDRALADLVRDEQPIPEEMFFLAGLQRIEYVFADPENKDIVLAGPAEGWQIGAAGEVVGEASRQAVLRLDDLMEALRSVRAARATGITCSIEPSEEGLKRYARLINSPNRLQFSPQAMKRIEQAMGPQQVLLGGVDPDRHFARTMVAADYMMKRLAMGFEPASINDLPSYMDLLQRQPAQPTISSPRWWMTTNYESLLHSPDGLAWQIKGAGLKTMTEDSFLGADGRRTASTQHNATAQQWADTMTDNFDQLAEEFPVFGQLRGCVDLAVVGALIVKRDLLVAAGCQLEVLTDASTLRGPTLAVPRQVDSQVAFVRGRAGWIISVSGGVEIDAWSVVGKAKQDTTLKRTRQQALTRAPERWWW